jgi:hypothetical protein
MANEAMTREQKTAAIGTAWAEYRAGAVKLNRLPWTDYLDADERIWRRYLSIEKAVMAAPTISTQAA